MAKEKLVASDILREHVKPDEHVLIVGANFDPLIDPSAFYLSTHLSRGKGQLTLLDNKSTELLNLTRRKLEQLRRAGTSPNEKLVTLAAKLRRGDQDRFDNPAGLGDPHAYGHTIRSWKQAGFPMKSPRILISDARQIELPPNSVDVVFEHGALPWIENVSGAVTEYLRVAKPGGKVIVFTNDRYPKIHEELKALLARATKRRSKGKSDDPLQQIERVSEYEFLPAYDGRPFIRSLDSDKIKLDRLDPKSLVFFNEAGKRKFWMFSLHGLSNCSRGFVIKKKQAWKAAKKLA